MLCLQAHCARRACGPAYMDRDQRCKHTNIAQRDICRLKGTPNRALRVAFALLFVLTLPAALAVNESDLLPPERRSLEGASKTMRTLTWTGTRVRWSAVAVCRGSAYTEFMKLWTKLVGCFLIAWLPVLGYPAQAAFYPVTSSVAAHQQLKASHLSNMVTCEQGADHRTMRGQPVCHCSMGSLVCGVPAIPVTYAVMVVPSSPVYEAIAHTFAEQFIPELPAPPPRSA
jgi:hypothetical protein